MTDIISQAQGGGQDEDHMVHREGLASEGADSSDGDDAVSFVCGREGHKANMSLQLTTGSQISDVDRMSHHASLMDGNEMDLGGLKLQGVLTGSTSQVCHSHAILNFL